MQRFLLGALVLGIPLSITLAQSALAALAVVLAWRLFTRQSRLAGWPLAVPFLAYAAASLLSGLRVLPPDAALSSLRNFLLVAAFYVVLEALPDARRASRFVAALLALIGFVGAVSVLQVAFCPALTPWAPTLGRIARNCGRAHGFFSIYMTLAGVLSLVLLAALPALVTDATALFGRRFRGAAADAGEAPAPGGAPAGGGARLRVGPLLGLGLAWLLGAAAMAATQVRGAWLGMLAGVVVALLLVRRGRIVALAAIALVVAAVLLVPSVRQRAASIADPADATARERWAMWGSGLAIARDHPLTGVGPGQVRHVYPRYAAPEFRDKRRGHLHSTPVQILAERGFLGLGAWLSIFAVFFWRSAQVLKRLPAQAVGERALVAGSVAASAGFLVGGLTEYNFGDSEVVLVAYAVMALPFVVARDLGGRRETAGNGAGCLRRAPHPPPRPPAISRTRRAESR